jgi:hypothetical protein
MADIDTGAHPPRGELEPRQYLDRECVRVHESAHVAQHNVGAARLQQHADALAESRHVAAGERTVDGEDDPARSWGGHLGEGPPDARKLIAAQPMSSGPERVLTSDTRDGAT